MTTMTRIITVTMVALLLVGLAAAAFAGPRLGWQLQERDRDQVVEQVGAEAPDAVTRRDRDRLRTHAPGDTATRQDRERPRTHAPECDRRGEPERMAQRHEHGSEKEPVRACGRGD